MAKTKKEKKPWVKIAMWWKKADKFFSKAPKSIIGLPYTLKESVNWIFKHFSLYVGWPILGLTLMSALSLVKWPVWVYYIIISVIMIASLLFLNRIIRVAYKNEYKVDIIGKKKGRWNKYTLNENVEGQYWVGFVGDIMKLNRYDLTFDNDIREFFDNTPLIIGNLEGIIAERKAGWASQNHSDEIFEKLKRLTEPNGEKKSQWLLCLSNNHSGDFGYKKFNKTKDIAKDNGVEVFGSRINPFFPPPNLESISKNFEFMEKGVSDFLEFLKKINIVSGTMWRNHSKSCNYITLYEWKNDFFQNDKFNILYPHWHYENEDYIRKSMQENANELLLYGDDCYQKKPWDVIFGHHPHVPQAITEVSSKDPAGPKKLLAYSGGNFTSGVIRDKHNHGLIMKCEIGNMKGNVEKLAVGKIEWSYTKNKFKKWKLWWGGKKTIVIDEVQNDKLSYLMIRKKVLYSLYAGLILFFIVVALLLFFDYGISIPRLFLTMTISILEYILYLFFVGHQRRPSSINSKKAKKNIKIEK